MEAMVILGSPDPMRRSMRGPSAYGESGKIAQESTTGSEKSLRKGSTGR